MSCPICDYHRRSGSSLVPVGEPCDICDDSGTDSLGRYCRHCNAASRYYVELDTIRNGATT